MPAKYRIKNYKPNSYYHIYNRGIDKRDIFLDQDDFRKFLATLKRYLSAKPEQTKLGFKHEKPSISLHKAKMNLTSEVKVVAYCLMPNHFHLLIWQSTPDAIVKLMRRVCTNYSMYFNQKYKRRGTMFENVYRAVIVEPSDILAVSRYIHLNPVAKSVRRFGLVEASTGSPPSEYQYSSYRNYLKTSSDDWVDPSPVLEFTPKGGYRQYVDTFSGKLQDVSNDIGLDVDSV